MTEATRTALVPDESHFLYVLTRLDEQLLSALVGAVEDMDAGEEDAWRLPADFNAKAPYQAWTRVFDALPAALRGDENEREGHPEARTLVAPDGRHEHMPFYPVTVLERDLVVLRHLRDRLTRVLNREEDGGDLLDYIDALAENTEDRTDPGKPGRRPTTAADLVGELALVVTILDLDTDDTRLLLAEIGAKGPGETVVLTEAGEAAYQRTATEFNKHIAGGSGLDRFLY
ncbi:hypothetical protein QFZ66_008538 [Streptomyces sp. B4I13]|uniref:hypothetical protein n=1 Tax=Streptomyces sp. B4I13 TaxID=3042271 RepID=UPI002781EFB2|nr:hypothetical protein [Streptomyces sp. B4I13]MDQ0964570.1 hypothetical protein [Streptomyces sp. B4I13]